MIFFLGRSNLMIEFLREVFMILFSAYVAAHGCLYTGGICYSR